MAIIKTVKKVSKRRIDCNGDFDVTLEITAEPAMTGSSADIVLILDRSSSMTINKRLDSMKSGAFKLLDMVFSPFGGNKAGIVSFATDAVIECELTEDKKMLKTGINNIEADGITNQGEAFLLADKILDKSTAKEKIIVLFTDGCYNNGPEPLPITESIKSKGIKIYCIGVGKTLENLKLWASEPNKNYVSWSSDDQKIESLFEKIGKEIIGPGSKDGKLIEELNDDFVIDEIYSPSSGRVVKKTDKILEWYLDAIGTDDTETAKMTFKAHHISETGGIKKVNKSISYTDSSCVKVEFPSPTIEICCNTAGCVIIDDCLEPTDFTMEGCKDSAEILLNAVELTSLGRIVKVNAVIKNVCPEKRVAVAIQLSETDKFGNEYPRGMKAFTLPAHHNCRCKDIKVKCVDFVVPEDLDVTGNPCSLCNCRNFKARVIANYVDSCCICCDTIYAEPNNCI